MILFLDNEKQVIAVHDDDSLMEQYEGNLYVVQTNRQVIFKEVPDDDNIYTQKWNEELQDICLEVVGKKEKSQSDLLRELTSKIHITQRTYTTVEDKLNKIMMHLGIEA